MSGASGKGGVNESLYLKICEEIAEATLKSGRYPQDVKLVAITKGRSWDEAMSLYQQGQRCFGESRLAEALEKQVQAANDNINDCEWHLIGSLQNNKVRKAINHFSMNHFSLIHSVDTLKLAKKISECSVEAGIITNVLLQANCSGEETKHGFTPEEWMLAAEEVFNLPAISIQGLMTMASFPPQESTARQAFTRLRALKDSLQAIAGERALLRELSMGMSNDYKWAIEEGSTLIRIGSALFKS